MPQPVSRSSNAAHYVWGEVSHGWRLVDDPGLSVIEEEVPAGAGEEWHVHRTAQQFFYVLEGAAVLCLEDAEIPLAAGEGLTITAGQAHRFTNQSESPVKFIVVSSPSTQGDRFPVPSTAPRRSTEPRLARP
jgi:mannose-6-phosphate isomerase-like protein (cupin superfamily)